MEEYLPGRVYENLVRMAEYRNITLQTVLKQDAVVQQLNHYELVTIPGKRPASDPRGGAAVIIILIAPNSKYSSKSGDFKKLLKGLPKVGNEALDVMFVSDEPLTIYIKKLLVQYRINNPKITVEDYDYSKFMIEAPKHESVPRHSLASDKEVEEFCRMHFTSKEFFPKIVQSDTQAVWLGARPGMVVKIERVSETAGVAIAYRYCIK
jgi:DNA-directed RNA polymerase subunit H (RpoH/RPB5)